MRKDDWYGLGTSIVLHLVLLLLFLTTSLGVAEPEPIGYVAVEFGPVSEGRPVQRAAEDQPEATEPEEPEPEPEPEPQAAPPEKAKPVELAKQPTPVADEERVQTPETETISPAEQSEPAPVRKPEPKPEPKPATPQGGGATDGTQGEPQGQPGPTEQETKTAPFNIEGLNRSAVYAPLPTYAEKVNAVITMRVTVDPQGRITRIIPVKKANPRLEQAVRQVLQRWRFNKLPLNAPQESQTGTVTFTFRLE